MLKILNKFMKFAGGENEKRFHKAIVIGVIESLAMALKIPAIMCVLMGLLQGEDMKKYIMGSVAIMAVSLITSYICKMKSTMLQTEGGYLSCNDKRVEIAQKLRYLPMGYFNENSLGMITAVVTNAMEALSDVASRVVMICSQGILDTALIILMIFAFDWRIGLIALVGVGIFGLINHFMQSAGTKVSEEKIKFDQELVDIIVEYIQGISEVKSYSLTGASAKRLNAANEAAVSAFLQERLSFYGITYVVREIVESTPLIERPTLDDIFETHREAFGKASELIDRMERRDA